jgi:gluconolactonase
MKQIYRAANPVDAQLVFDLLDFPRGQAGVVLDADGNVYLTSGAVWVFDQTGKQVAELKVPESPSNVCFGGKDRKTLFITARTGLYAIRCTVAGVGSQ